MIQTKNINLFFLLLSCKLLIHPSTLSAKPDLPTTEVRQLLQNLAWENNRNRTESRVSVIESISEKSKKYYIPVNITHRLMEISKLHNEGPQAGEGLETDQDIQNVLTSSGIPLDQLTGDVRSQLVDHIRSQEWTYNEKLKTVAITVLGDIGQRQMIPMDVVYYLRNLIFEIKNPHVRLAAIVTLGKISILYPPDQEFLRKLALYMKQFRETSEEPPDVFTRSFEYKLLYAALEIIAQKRFFPVDLIEELLVPLNKPKDELERVAFLQKILPIAKKDRWGKLTIDSLQMGIQAPDQKQNGSQASIQNPGETSNDIPDSQCFFKFVIDDEPESVAPSRVYP